MKRTIVWVVAAVCILSACGSRAANAGGGTDRNTLTREQMIATNFSDLYSALEKLRPEWLNSRGPTSLTNTNPTMATVYMNGQLLGAIESLREVRVLDISSVRYWASGPAAARFGMGHPRGVIEIIRQ